jgi:NAD+ diphosphatase
MSPGFTGGTLDRADHLRLDEGALQRARQHPAARILVLEGLDPRESPGGGLAWRAATREDDAREAILLGFDGDAPRFALLAPDGPRGGSMAVLQLLHRLPAAEVALYGGARSLVDWHYRHGFCARCGAATSVFRAGWGRRCASCSAEHFPRVDPVVIMLAEHEGRVLLGRQAQFPPRMYSALAGFIEPGESIEEAVRRELHEEAGVRATSVRYVLSQPWPFPSSLMIGCIAPVASDALTLDTTELQDAIWADRDEVAAVMAGSREQRFSTPPPLAIAHSLLNAWLDGGRAQPA